MTGAQAKTFVEQIKKNGAGERRIADFNRGVIKTLRLPVLGGIVAAGLTQAVKAQNLTDALLKKGHYKRALEALEKGAWRQANAEIQGGFPASDNNLISDMIEAGHERDAMILLGRWKEREADFIKIENGQSVAGVPDSF